MRKNIGKCGKFVAATAFAVVCQACTLFPSSNAAGVGDVVVSMQIDDPIMAVNGVETEIDEGCGTTPIVSDGHTLVPIRAIIETFDGSVSWDSVTQTVTLAMEGDVIQITIDSNVAYLNDTEYTLDVAPTIINERTMLPIRFIAEGFNIGVAWEGETQTVTLVRNAFDDEEYDYIMSVVPSYSGYPYVEINNGVPLFEDYEIIGGSFEYYSKLDELGRCDVCMASVGEDIMPTEERESISSVIPTGWVNATYDTVDGKYLYNRCHLIGYQLTGENANERNLITGTRYLNIEGMLPFENEIDDYVERTGNNVMYRVTPIFTGDNLVADGVLLEAYSVEDSGRGVMFCVYCYNVQPTVVIDYATGVSRSENAAVVTAEPTASGGTDKVSVSGVYRTPNGKKYHFDAECGGKNSYAVTMADAISAGLTPCAKCAK